MRELLYRYIVEYKYHIGFEERTGPIPSSSYQQLKRMEGKWEYLRKNGINNEKKEEERENDV